MRVRLGVLLAAVCGALTIGPPAASAGDDVFDRCDQPRHSCSYVTVPLDRSGAVPGTVRLKVDRERARRAVRPPIVMLSGSAGSSSLLESGSELIGTEGRSRDVIAMDLRGTGSSGVLRCPALERAGLHDTTAAAAACARRLGPRRAFYTARDSAQDLEAVRQTLGAERIAIFGSSYGARVALAYAQRYPTRVDRLVLDSPVHPDGLDALQRSNFAAVPGVVRSRCRGGACGRASRTPLEDLIEVAQRLEGRPLRGSVVDGRGRRRPTVLGPADLFILLGVDGALTASGDQRAIPGFLRNARRGDFAPLLRAHRTVEDVDFFFSVPGFVKVLSLAAFAASTCEESQLPWARTAPLSTRQGQAQSVIASLPASAFAPFGPNAAAGGALLELCQAWPIASPAPEPSGPLPPIPTLVVAGSEDLDAPVADAAAVAGLIPGARLLELPGSSGQALVTAVSRCAQQSASRFLAGGDPGRCDRVPRPERAMVPPPMSLAEVAPGRSGGRAGRTLGAVRSTLDDVGERLPVRFVQRIYELVRRKQPLKRIERISIGVGGLRGGHASLSLRTDRMRIRRLSYVPGVRIDGKVIDFENGRAPRRGVLRVTGPAAARGRLVIRGTRLVGRLGGRRVSTRLDGSAFDENTFGARNAANALAAPLATALSAP